MEEYLRSILTLRERNRVVQFPISRSLPVFHSKESSLVDVETWLDSGFWLDSVSVLEAWLDSVHSDDCDDVSMVEFLI